MLDFRNERDGRVYRTYISGDTLIHDELHEIPRRFRTSSWGCCRARPLVQRSDVNSRAPRLVSMATNTDFGDATRKNIGA